MRPLQISKYCTWLSVLIYRLLYDSLNVKWYSCSTIETTGLVNELLLAPPAISSHILLVQGNCKFNFSFSLVEDLPDPLPYRQVRINSRLHSKKILTIDSSWIIRQHFFQTLQLRNLKLSIDTHKLKKINLWLVLN